MTRKPILVLDFDGVLHSYSSGWKGAAVIPDPPVPGFAQFLERAVEAFHVCVYSSRSAEPEGRAAMRIWLHGRLCEHYKREFPQGWPPLWITNLLLQIGFPETKPAAFVGLDDRALTFTGTWPDIDELRSFRPWWQQPAD
jgi:hypothetical protein